ncbi:MAG: hypothetical protein QXO15_03345 [Nitrososphaerota archaeon]
MVFLSNVDLEFTIDSVKINVYSNGVSIEASVRPSAWVYRYIIDYCGSYLYFDNRRTAEEALKMLTEGSEWHILMVKLMKYIRTGTRLKHCKNVFSGDKKRSEVERKLLLGLWMSVILRRNEYDAYSIADIIEENLWKFVDVYTARKYLRRFRNIDAYLIAHGLKR